MNSVAWARICRIGVIQLSGTVDKNTNRLISSLAKAPKSRSFYDFPVNRTIRNIPGRPARIVKSIRVRNFSETPATVGPTANVDVAKNEVRDEGGLQGNWPTQRGSEHSQQVALSIFKGYGLSDAEPLSAEAAREFLQQRGWPAEAAKIVVPKSDPLTSNAFINGAMRYWGDVAGAAGLPEFLGLCVQMHKNRNLFSYWSIDTLYPLGDWRQFELMVADVRVLLAKEMGLQKGARVAAICRNNIEWAAVAFATWGTGAVFVPIPETQRKEDWGHILIESRAEVLFVANKDVYDQVQLICDKVQKQLWKPIDVIVLDGFDGHNFDSFGFTRNLLEDEACLIYTPTEEGPPRSASLTHSNIMSAALSSRFISGLTSKDISLSLMPWSIPAAMSSELLGLMSAGGRIAICDGETRIQFNASEVRPTVMFAVAKMVDNLAEQTQTANGHEWYEKWFLQRAVQAATAVRKGSGSVVEQVVNLLLRWTVLFRIRNAFGRRLKRIFIDRSRCKEKSRDFVLSVVPEIRKIYSEPSLAGPLGISTPENRAATYGRIEDILYVHPSISITSDGSNHGDACGLRIASMAKNDKVASRSLIGEIGTESVTLRGLESEKICIGAGKGFVWARECEATFLCHMDFIDQILVTSPPQGSPAEIAALIFLDFDMMNALQARRFGHSREQNNEQILEDDFIRQEIENRLKTAASGILGKGALAGVRKVQYALLSQTLDIEAGTLASDLSVRRGEVLKLHADKLNKSMHIIGE